MKNIYTTGLIPSFCPISFPPHLLSSIYPYHPFIHLVIHLSTSLFLYPLRHPLSTSSSIYPLRHPSIHFVIPLYTSSFLYTLRHSSIHFVIPLYTSSFLYTLRHSLYPLRYSRVLYRHSRLLIVIPAQAGIQK